MEKNKFINYLKDNKNLDESSLKELQTLCSEFPYFQIANLLLIKNLKKLRKPEYFENLQKLIIHIPDKERMYKDLNAIELLSYEAKNNGKKKKEVKKKELRKEAEDNTRKTIKVDKKPIEITKKDKPESARKPAQVKLKEERPEEIIENDFFELDIDMEEPLIIADEEEKEKSVKEGSYLDENVDKENSGDLIDKFISAQPKIVPKKQDQGKQDDVSVKSVEEREDYMTDTLARIYIKQGYYSKAIFIYEKLSLKYPEKNTYFAAQIEKIKKLTNNL